MARSAREASGETQTRPARKTISQPGPDTRGWFRRIVIGVPFFWLFALFLVPFLIVFKISLSEVVTAMPPYQPTFGSIAGWWSALKEFSFDNYRWIAGDPLYFNSYVLSLGIAAASTVLTLLLAYPLAYGISKASPAWRTSLVMLVILPFWTSFLIRVYAWIAILKPEGLLNQLLLWLRVIDQPLVILNTPTAIFIGIVYSYLPFMILPIYASLERMDQSLIEAAADLGATPFKTFWTVTFPLSLPGVIAGCFLVFIPATGEFVIPDLLGGSRTLMIGKTVWLEFFTNRDWPVASAVTVVLVIILVLPIVLFQRVQARAQ
ncbi:ABC transporter permease subunit [Jiella sp. MQZ9-1]|uniref:ABC transporter permease subunit n=1 Tax=Jiella flava TaxID=2816857 RepID=A0A939JV26_9HYPH|nr:ABC transporter permease subunit [Jiella flava]MBO0661567.1 ABC transporter permease subunit [Jiella flava]MCD2470209.1 ABC transporter permease subunit [Jiella flava]